MGSKIWGEYCVSEKKRTRRREEEHLESMPKIAFRCYFSDVTIDTCSSLTQLRVLQVMLCSLTQCSSPEKNVVFLTAFLLPHHLLFRDDPFLSCFPCNSCHAFQVVFYSSNHKISRRNSSVSFFFCRKHCKTEQSSTTSLWQHALDFAWITLCLQFMPSLATWFFVVSSIFFFDDNRRQQVTDTSSFQVKRHEILSERTETLFFEGHSLSVTLFRK